MIGEPNARAFACFQRGMEETAYLLINNLEDGKRCEDILQKFRSQSTLPSSLFTKHMSTLLDYFLTMAPDSLFRRLFHVSRSTLPRIVNEIRETKVYRYSNLCSSGGDKITHFVCVSILYLNTCFSVNCCALFSGLSNQVVESYISTFNKMMNELKDKIIRFPALNYQNLLKVNSKRFFPGAVGVVGRFCFFFNFHFHFLFSFSFSFFIFILILICKKTM